MYNVQFWPLFHLPISYWWYDQYSLCLNWKPGNLASNWHLFNSHSTNISRIVNLKTEGERAARTEQFVYWSCHNMIRTQILDWSQSLGKVVGTAKWNRGPVPTRPKNPRFMSCPGNQPAKPTRVWFLASSGNEPNSNPCLKPGPLPRYLDPLLTLFMTRHLIFHSECGIAMHTVSTQWAGLLLASYLGPMSIIPQIIHTKVSTFRRPGCAARCLNHFSHEPADPWSLHIAWLSAAHVTLCHPNWTGGCPTRKLIVMMDNHYLHCWKIFTSQLRGDSCMIIVASASRNEYFLIDWRVAWVKSLQGSLIWQTWYYMGK